MMVIGSRGHWALILLRMNTRKVTARHQRKWSARVLVRPGTLAAQPAPSC